MDDAAISEPQASLPPVRIYHTWIGWRPNLQGCLSLIPIAFTDFRKYLSSAIEDASRIDSNPSLQLDLYETKIKPPCKYVFIYHVSILKKWTRCCIQQPCEDIAKLSAPEISWFQAFITMFESLSRYPTGHNPHDREPLNITYWCIHGKKNLSQPLDPRSFESSEYSSITLTLFLVKSRVPPEHNVSSSLTSALWPNARSLQSGGNTVSQSLFGLTCTYHLFLEECWVDIVALCNYLGLGMSFSTTSTTTGSQRFPPRPIKIRTLYVFVERIYRSKQFGWHSSEN